MTKKALRGLAKRTAASNRAFAKMGKAKQRIAIAKDILKALTLKQIKATRGNYVYSEALGDAPGWADLQSTLPTIPPCNVCAKGAILLCAVARRDRLKVGQLGSLRWWGEDFSKTLGGIFSPDQLDKMEDAFEYGLAANASDTTAMRKVMENVVRNKGTFVAPPERD